MIETQKKKRNTLAAILGPLLALMLLGGGAWFLWWYWMGGNKAPQVVHLSAASLNVPAGGGFGGGRGGGGPGGGGPGGGFGRRGQNGGPNGGPAAPGAFMPQFRVTNGNIRQLTANLYNITSGNFIMRVGQTTGAPPVLSLSGRREDIFTNSDLVLMNLAVNMATNPLDGKDSGASPDIIKKISDALGPNTFMLNIKLADADTADAKSEWEKFMTAQAGQRNTLAQELVDTVAALSKKEVEADRPDFDALVAKIRQIVPIEQEEQYLLAIRDAQADRAMVAATQAARNTRAATRPATTRPANIARKTPTTKPAAPTIAGNPTPAVGTPDTGNPATPTVTATPVTAPPVVTSPPAVTPIVTPTTSPSVGN